MTEHLDMTVLSAFLDNELESDEYDRAKRHLDDCPSCRATLAELRAISQGLQAIACAPPPAELRTGWIGCSIGNPPPQAGGAGCRDR